MTRAALSLPAIDALDQRGFVAALGFIFEHSPWVMERAWFARPFATREALLQAADAVLRAASPEEKLALIRAHPELGSKLAIGESLTAASAAEQAGAGLDRLTPAEFARFSDLSAAYARRFGHPFIICVRLHDRSSILAALERRLTADPGAEIEESLTQITQIARLRLDDTVAP